ncbi:uncharacterized protein [Panulirus ornatus]|uniref:uncharacterized protein n=1 Tax=Panulirus ornatus TaxID=150431 RepID=UPI003A87B2D8
MTEYMVRRSLRAFLENEWRRLYVLTQQQEQGAHDGTQPDAEDPSVREARDKSRRRRREAYLARPSSTSEPDLVHFDIEWNFRPVSVTTEEARSSSGTPGQSNGTGGVSNGTAGPSNGTSGHVNSSSGPSDSTPDWARPQKFLQKPKFAGRRGMVGEPYVASLGPNPSPRYIHILKPTNSCREVWMRLCPPQPASSRPPRPTPKPPPQLRLVYAGGGAPCPTPTTLLLMQQPAGAHNVTVFHGVVCIGDEIEITSMRRT